MKIIHLSDLHLGKRVKEFSMLEDQEYILKKTISLIDEELPDCIIIAGDVYDKPIPPAEAVRLFDDFLTMIAKRNIPVMVISGNHDSQERIAFGARLVNASGIYISPVYDGSIEKVTLEKEGQMYNFFLIPYLKPQYIKRYFPDEKIESYDDGIRLVINNLDINESQVNIAVVHQFITGGERCESEDISIGGLDNINGDIFNGFDYVALGHLHKAQKVIRENIRYSGTLLKYSFSEVNHKKSVPVINIDKDKNFEYILKEITPKRDLKEIKGKYNEITSLSYYKEMNKDDYFHITLTDEEDIPEALYKLRTIYPNIMQLDYDNTRTRQNNIIENTYIKEKTQIEYLEDFYMLQNNQGLSEEQKKIAMGMIENIWE